MASISATAERVRGLAARHGAKAALFIVNFGASKVAAFLGPLVLAAVLAPEVYGAIELALSAGLLIALVTGLGVSSSAALLALRPNPVPTADVQAACFLGQGVLLLAVAAVSAASGMGPVVVLVFTVCVLAAAQGALGAHYRIGSQPNLAAWATSLALLSMTVIGVGLAFAGLASTAAVATATTVVAIALMLAAAMAFAATATPDLRQRLGEAVRLGLPMLGLGFVSIWLASSGRFLTGAFLPLESVSVYAIDFRIAGLLLIIHQMLSMAAFAPIFRMRTRRFDKLASIYLAVLGALTVALCLAFPTVIVLLPLKALPAGSAGDAVAIFGSVAVTVFLWNASAALEMRIGKAKLAGRAALASGIGALAVLCVAWALGTAGQLDLPLLAWLLAAQMLLMTLIQIGLLAQRRLVLPRFLLVVLLSSAAIATQSLQI